MALSLNIRDTTQYSCRPQVLGYICRPEGQERSYAEAGNGRTRTAERPSSTFVRPSDSCHKFVSSSSKEKFPPGACVHLPSGRPGAQLRGRGRRTQFGRRRRSRFPAGLGGDHKPAGQAGRVADLQRRVALPRAAAAFHGEHEVYQGSSSTFEYVRI